jgi:hypothetical protein
MTVGGTYASVDIGISIISRKKKLLHPSLNLVLPDITFRNMYAFTQIDNTNK